MIQTTKSTVIECGRINSTAVTSGNEDSGDKSAWVNKIPTLILKQGDEISLESCVINLPGADSNGILYHGTETVPHSNLSDNFSLLNIGFYLNHNAINSAALPLIYSPVDQATIGQAKLQVYNQ